MIEHLRLEYLAGVGMRCAWCNSFVRSVVPGSIGGGGGAKPVRKIGFSLLHVQFFSYQLIGWAVENLGNLLISEG